jgi:hypothetical protein
MIIREWSNTFVPISRIPLEALSLTPIYFTRMTYFMPPPYAIISAGPSLNMLHCSHSWT